MTKVLILGGGGMVGQKLAGQLKSDGLSGTSIDDITALDLGFPKNSIAEVKEVVGNLSDKSKLAKLVAQRPDIVYHLAAVVSGEAERDFDKGWQVNMFHMWQLLELLWQENIASDGTYCPKVIFTSSVAVFGGPFPEYISDDFLTAPQTSYGAQKAACELILSDFSRKGFVDGMSLRLPTICVRPGKPNLAASSFFSGIIREPLNGQQAVLPVADSVRHSHASPRAAAGFLRHAASLQGSDIGARRALNLPGVSCTVGDQIEALRRAAGQAAIDLIVPQPDPEIIKIVDTWPKAFDPQLALSLGFSAEQSFDQIIEIYLADDFEP
ncbi:MAG: SDR family oxidoreductase [Rhodobacteraceae bacterium]|nr:MAG: SDR family oxidoreductase [Paracoccaceae bacterium]